MLASLRAERSFNPAPIFTRNRSKRPKRIRPNPPYSFFPMVIAKCLHSPQQCSDGRICRNEPCPTFHLVIGVELKFDNLRGFFRRSDKLPFFDGVLASLNEQGMSTHDPCAFHASVWRDHDFDFDLAGNVHPLGEFRIRRRRLGLDLASGFVGRASLSKSRGARKQKRGSGRHSPLPPSTSSHRHNSL